jgi:hypothetical protein
MKTDEKKTYLPFDRDNYHRNACSGVPNGFENECSQTCVSAGSLPKAYRNYRTAVAHVTHCLTTSKSSVTRAMTWNVDHANITKTCRWDNCDMYNRIPNPRFATENRKPRISVITSTRHKRGSKESHRGPIPSLSSGLYVYLKINLLVTFFFNFSDFFFQ